MIYITEFYHIYGENNFALKYFFKFEKKMIYENA